MIYSYEIDCDLPQPVVYSYKYPPVNSRNFFFAHRQLCLMQLLPYGIRSQYWHCTSIMCLCSCFRPQATLFDAVITLWYLKSVLALYIYHVPLHVYFDDNVREATLVIRFEVKSCCSYAIELILPMSKEAKQQTETSGTDLL